MFFSKMSKKNCTFASDMYSKEEIERRAQAAEELFARGFNCSQAVVAALSDLYDMDQQTALRVSASFGGGTGRMRMTCGTANALFLLAGMQTGNTKPDHPELKMPNYAFVRSLAQEFEKRHGSLICAELLGLNGLQPKQKMPCKQMTGEAVRQYLTALNSMETTSEN